MPVSEPTAYALLQAFGLLEFELKKIPRFTGRSRGRAQVNWNTVEEAVDQLLGAQFLDLVSDATREKLVGGGRDRPMIQLAVAADEGYVARFEPRYLNLSDARALVEATRRVRNNLFHGGKEDPLEEPHPGDDQEWAVAAREIAELLLRLVRFGPLRQSSQP